MLLRIKAGVPLKLDDGDNPTYEQWMRRVDRLVSNAAGCGVDDLPDCSYRDWYDLRVRPVRAAARALKAAGADAF